MSSPRLLPVFAAALSSILGGSSAVAIRYVIDDSDPISIAFLRCGGAGIAMAVVMFAATKARVLRRDLAPVAALGVLMFGGFGYLFSAGLAYVPAARGALVVAAMPILVLVLATAMGRERMTLAKAVGAALGFAGVFIALGDRASAGPEAWRGDLLLLGAALAGTFHAVLSVPYLRRNAALPVMVVQLLAGSVALVAVLVVRGDPLAGLVQFSPNQWFVVFWIMFVGGMASFYMWFWALERVPASAVALTISFNPVAAAVGGAMLLSEPVTLNLLLGLVAIAVGLAVAARARASA
ncbi:MAG: DMT family transporter [Telmatospirillum sp.]|nr:DMT family transporter [Telmatospirillum sp.]